MLLNVDYVFFIMPIMVSMILVTRKISNALTIIIYMCNHANNQILGRMVLLAGLEVFVK